MLCEQMQITGKYGITSRETRPNGEKINYTLINVGAANGRQRATDRRPYEMRIHHIL